MRDPATPVGPWTPLLVAGAAVAAAPAVQPQTPPNVVLIVVDDLGWRDLGCQGSRYYQTPHIDALAAEGVRFGQAYAAAAVCSPSRAAVLTGRYPARYGITDWIRARFQRPGGTTPDAPPTEWTEQWGQLLSCPANGFWLPHREQTVAELLRNAGYATAHVGKWHLGDDEWYPTEQGFDENHGGCDFGQPPSYFDPYANDRLPDGIPTLPPRRAGEYLTDREAAECTAFIAAHRDRPFFLHYAPYAVHTPIQAPDDAIARYADRAADGRQNNPRYAAMVDRVDRAVGAIVASLAAAGLRERTLVIFTSDNGGLSGPTDNRPLRAGKGHAYEGGLRVPFIMHWPGTIANGGECNAPVSGIDILPTVLAACRITAPHGLTIDGVSLLALAHNPARGTMPRDLVWHFPHYRQGLRIRPYSVLRRGRWKLIHRYEGARTELFDLAADPRETRDVADDNPDVVNGLGIALRSALREFKAAVPRENPAHTEAPRVLLLGDSISMGYAPHVAAALRGDAFVTRPTFKNGADENCAGTLHGAGRVEAWLRTPGARASGRAWDVIHFNFGLHDLKRVRPDGRNSNDPDDPRQSEPERYEEQLRRITATLRATGAQLVFATTTPVPGPGVRPYRDPADVELYNDIARRVMTAAEVPINDLYGFASTRLEEIQKASDVHFTAAGSRALAEPVAAAIREALAGG